MFSVKPIAGKATTQLENVAFRGTQTMLMDVARRCVGKFLIVSISMSSTLTLVKFAVPKLTKLAFSFVNDSSVSPPIRKSRRTCGL